MKFIANALYACLSSIKRAFLKTSGDCKIIGEVLKQKKIITEEQLQNALEIQNHKLQEFGQAVPLGRIIVELGYAPEDRLVQAINDHYKLSVTSLSDDIKELIKKKRGTFIDRLPAARIPIWLQFSAATIFIILLTSFVLNYIVLYRQREQYRQQILKIGKVSLNIFTRTARIPLLQDDIPALNTLVRNSAVVEELVYAIIVDPDYVIKAHSDADKIGGVLERIGSGDKTTREGEVTYFNRTLPDGKPVLNLAQPIMFKDKKLGEVHVGVSINFLEKLIRGERILILIITLYILFFGIVMAVLFGFRFSRPVSQLLLATQEIAKGNYCYKVASSRNDELGNLAVAFNQMGEELWKKSLMQESFGKYIGSEVLDMIMANPESKWLKGHRNEATILFADVRGFTSYSDARDPEKLVEELNEYFEIAARSALKYGGYIDKFIGDAVLCVFGVPVYRKDHVERAVRAAVELQRMLRERTRHGNELLSSVGIGIDSGIVVSGNIGSQLKMEYTVIGDSVNMASRLYEFAGPGEIVISKSVREHLGDMITVEALAPQKIKGKPGQAEIFKMLEI
jgi:adenylate cyclase